jgi:hypothetical protein
MASIDTAPSGMSPKRKMSIWKKIGIGFLAFLAFIAGVVVLALWLTADVVAPVERQLAFLRQGDVKAAYGETSLAFRDNVPFEKFVAFVKLYPSLSRNKSYSFNERSVDAKGTGTVKGTLTDDRGAVLPVEFRLVKEDGAWRILSIRIGDG